MQEERRKDYIHIEAKIDSIKNSLEQKIDDLRKLFIRQWSYWNYI